MHHVFLGGISQYYYQNGALVNDPNVPFVRTISRLSQWADGSYEEFVLSNEMPGLLGAGAEFIPKENIPYLQADIIDLAAITADSIHIGDLIGGISSPTLNPFSNNQSNLTSSNAVIYQVWLKRSSSNGIAVSSPVNSVEILVFPNPTAKELTIDFNLENKHNVELFVLDVNGKLVHEVYYEKVKNAKKMLDVKELQLQSGTYSLQFIIDDQQTITKHISVQ